MCLPLLLNLKRSEAVLDQTDKNFRQAQGTELPFVLKTKRERKLSLRKVFLLANIQSLSSFFYCCYFIFFQHIFDVITAVITKKYFIYNEDILDKLKGSSKTLSKF